MGTEPLLGPKASVSRAHFYGGLDGHPPSAARPLAPASSEDPRYPFASGRGGALPSVPFNLEFL